MVGHTVLFIGFAIGDKINKCTCGYDDMRKICPNCKIENDEQCKAIAKVFEKLSPEDIQKFKELAIKYSKE